MTPAAPTPYPSMVQLQKARQDMAFQRFLARSFGQRSIVTNDGVTVIAYRWRGQIYVTHMYRDPEERSMRR